MSSFRRVVIGAAFLICMPVAGFAQPGVARETPGNINANGRATVRALPDRATLLLVVQSNAATPGEAAEAVTRIERAVIDTLARLGVARTAVTATSYGVTPARLQPGMSSAPTGALFSGRSVISLRLTQIDRMPTLTSAALAKGAALIGQPRFESSAEDSLRAVAFREAIVNAERQATLLAEGMHGRLGRLRDLNADEPVTYEQPQQYFPVDTPYDNGTRSMPEVTITVTVRGRWELITAPPG
jgi:uncharacterized protein YggE